MNILILTGSPHKRGTSNTLAAEFIRGAQEAGHTTQVYDCARGNLHPCLACNACGMDGPCVQKDDGNQVLEALLAADMVVFVTPVYYFGMSAQLKRMIDRFYARNGAITARRLPAALIATSWDDDDKVMRALQDHFVLLFDYLAFENRGMLLAKGAGTVENIPPRYYEQAYDMGRKL